MARRLSLGPVETPKERELNRRIVSVVAKARNVGLGYMRMVIGGKSLIAKTEDAYDEVRTRLCVQQQPH